MFKIHAQLTKTKGLHDGISAENSNSLALPNQFMENIYGNLGIIPASYLVVGKER
jgi:hypothetical protein